MVVLSAALTSLFLVELVSERGWGWEVGATRCYEHYSYELFGLFARPVLRWVRSLHPTYWDPPQNRTSIESICVLFAYRQAPLSELWRNTIFAKSMNILFAPTKTN